MRQRQTNFSFYICHCEPKGRGNLVFLRLRSLFRAERGISEFASSRIHYGARNRSAPRNDSPLDAFVLLAVIAAFLAVFFVGPSISQAAPHEAVLSLTEKLESWNVEEAWAEAKGLLDKDQKIPSF